MLTLLALLAALLGPGPILADNSGGGQVDSLIVASDVPGSGPTGQTTTSGGVTGSVPPIGAPVDDNSGGGPIDRK